MKITSPTYSLIITVVHSQQLTLDLKSQVWTCISFQFQIQWHHTCREISYCRNTYTTNLANTTKQSFCFLLRKLVRHLPSHHHEDLCRRIHRWMVAGERKERVKEEGREGGKNCWCTLCFSELCGFLRLDVAGQCYF